MIIINANDFYRLRCKNCGNADYLVGVIENTMKSCLDGNEMSDKTREAIHISFIECQACGQSEYAPYVEDYKRFEVDENF